MHLTEAEHQDGAPLRALVVEDDRAYREAVRRMLARHGIDTVPWAPDGPDPVDLARTERPDVVLLDWRLPDVNGVELCRRLTSDPELTGTPVIMLTALSDHRDRSVARHAGAAAFVTKGVTAEELARVIHRLLD
jgi:DNA-binding response OmpR family regulator